MVRGVCLHHPFCIVCLGTHFVDGHIKFVVFGVVGLLVAPESASHRQILIFQGRESMRV